jgi:hypothetical protein
MKSVPMLKECTSDILLRKVNSMEENQNYKAQDFKRIKSYLMSLGTIILQLIEDLVIAEEIVAIMHTTFSQTLNRIWI